MLGCLRTKWSRAERHPVLFVRYHSTVNQRLLASTDSRVSPRLEDNANSSSHSLPSKAPQNVAEMTETVVLEMRYIMVERTWSVQASECDMRHTTRKAAIAWSCARIGDKDRIRFWSAIGCKLVGMRPVRSTSADNRMDSVEEGKQMNASSADRHLRTNPESQASIEVWTLSQTDCICLLYNYKSTEHTKQVISRSRSLVPSVPSTHRKWGKTDCCMKKRSARTKVSRGPLLH